MNFVKVPFFNLLFIIDATLRNGFFIFFICQLSSGVMNSSFCNIFIHQFLDISQLWSLSLTSLKVGINFFHSILACPYSNPIVNFVIYIATIQIM